MGSIVSSIRSSVVIGSLFLAVGGAADEPTALSPINGKPVTGRRSETCISGIYPHLTVYGIYSQNGAHLKSGHDECGIGAIVPWADRLWMVNYAPHQPTGSEHKLYSIDNELKLTVHPESVGGTPAGRMIHAESKQLLIAHYLIDEAGRIRVIPPAQMPIRVTAIARHLNDPANMVYYIDMEGSIWEANVHSLAVKRLFKKPVPGWHGKGGYTSQGRLVVSNNGELHAGSYDDLIVGGPAINSEERGVLAEFDGTNWKIVERRQYTEVTGPAGIAGGSDDDQPIWTMGWDRRSVRLKVLDQGNWHTYLLPKAALCNDASHGWYTEWPRIRQITADRWMMDMHGMFFDFPKTFSATKSSGIKPIGSHLRYVPDFCGWKNQLVLASDETSIQGNPLAGQPQTNLWFGKYEDLKSWGPASGFGGPWIEDPITANTPSEPFLVAGFDRRVLHLALGTSKSLADATRATDQQKITQLPDALAKLPRVTVKRGDWKQPAAGFQFTVDHPVTVFLAVDNRGDPKLPARWIATDMTLLWGDNHSDSVYKCEFPAGTVQIPPNEAEHAPGAYAMPHTAFVSSGQHILSIKALPPAKVSYPHLAHLEQVADQASVNFRLQVDVQGNGQWSDLGTVEVPTNGFVSHLLPSDLDAAWLRLRSDQDCIATAFLHQTTSRFADPAAGRELFAGLADATATDPPDTEAALVYPEKTNRNLRVIGADGKQFEFTKGEFKFEAVETDLKLADLLAVKPEFTVDDASVILTHRGNRLRIPKGGAAFDKPFASGWPRANREVESERHLANIHGTFYEVPLVNNGQPPAFDQMRPVASHNKQITDFCSWNGLLVLAGVSSQATADGHVYRDQGHKIGLWFGGVDDLWKLGKPTGQGGPWNKSPVQANLPSDPYLMTGYDRKTLTLAADKDTSIVIEVDVDHQSGWHKYKTIAIKANEVSTFEFPKSFSAHWLRLTALNDCIATGQLRYE